MHHSGNILTADAIELSKSSYSCSETEKAAGYVIFHPNVISPLFESNMPSLTEYIGNTFLISLIL